MSQIKTIFLDRGSTLVNSEVICSRAYVMMFREFGTRVGPEKIFTRFRGVELYGTVDIISEEQDVTMVQADTEYICRTEVIRLFDTELEDIAGMDELLANINVPMCIVSNGPVDKMQHPLGRLNMLYYFPEKLFSGYDIQHWRSNPALMFHAAETMDTDVRDCILVDDSSAGA